MFDFEMQARARHDDGLRRLAYRQLTGQAYERPEKGNFSLRIGAWWAFFKASAATRTDLERPHIQT